MKVHILFCLKIFFWTILCNYSLNAQNPQEYEKQFKEKVGYLLVLNSKNKQKYAYSVSMQVYCWVSSNPRTAIQGFIEEFTHNTMIVSGKEVLIENLIAIRRIDHPVHNTFKIVGPILGVTGAIAGLARGAFNNISQLDDGTQFFALSGVSLVAGFSPIFTASKKHRAAYQKFRIVLPN